MSLIEDRDQHDHFTALPSPHELDSVDDAGLADDEETIKRYQSTDIGIQKNLKFKSKLIKKIKCKQTDESTLPIALPFRLDHEDGNYFRRAFL